MRGDGARKQWVLYITIQRKKDLQKTMPWSGDSKIFGDVTSVVCMKIYSIASVVMVEAINIDLNYSTRRLCDAFIESARKTSF
jgi:hypothetical protein